MKPLVYSFPQELKVQRNCLNITEWYNRGKTTCCFIKCVLIYEQLYIYTPRMEFSATLIYWYLDHCEDNHILSDELNNLSRLRWLGLFNHHWAYQELWIYVKFGTSTPSSVTLSLDLTPTLIAKPKQILAHPHTVIFTEFGNIELTAVTLTTEVMRTTVVYGIKVYSENFPFTTQRNRFNTGFTH